MSTEVGWVARETHLDPALYGVLSMVLVPGTAQLWLLSATLNAFRGGDDCIVVPAAGASQCLLNLGLLLYPRQPGTKGC